jgi:glutamate dehydrogenase (NADP+)
MQQNASRDSWTATSTPSRSSEIMVATSTRCLRATAEEFGAPGNYVVGANIAGFILVAKAMVALGLI